MDVEQNKDDSTSQKMAGKPGSASAAAQKVLDRGADAYGHAEKAVRDVYDKTAETVSKTYEQAKSYGSENPGTTILIAFGIGLGLCPTRGQRALQSSSGVFPLRFSAAGNCSPQNQEKFPV
jgi:ElaB/YqjD/DUF883 family membrane-anchored ribosome-binding protein